MLRKNEVTVATQAALDKAIKREVPHIYIDSPEGVPLLLPTSGYGHFTVLGDSHVVAGGNSRIEAYGNSRVWVRDDSYVVARDNSRIVAQDNSLVDALHNSRVEASGNSRVRARDNTHVEARDESRVEAWDTTRVQVWGYTRVEARGNSRVVAWGNSRIEAGGDSTVMAMDSSTVVALDKAYVEASCHSRIEARGHGTVTALDNSRVEAYGNSRVEANDYSHVVATPLVAVHIYSTTATVEGGVSIDTTQYNNDGQSWCEFHGVTVTDGKAILYKAVYEDWRTDRGPKWTYAPGSIVKAHDFDTIRLCGQGLHLCPSPRLSRRYLLGATRYVAVEVDVDTLVPLYDKAKVPQCRVLYAVNLDGKRIFR